MAKTLLGPDFQQNILCLLYSSWKESTGTMALYGIVLSRPQAHTVPRRIAARNSGVAGLMEGPEVLERAIEEHG